MYNREPSPVRRAEAEDSETPWNSFCRVFWNSTDARPDGASGG